MDLETELLKEGAYPLIGEDDPPPFSVVNADGTANILLVADHASRAFPGAMGKLGLDDWVLDRHVAYDIGSADVTLRLSQLLDAPAVLAGYSRLIIDCNRRLDDPTAFIEVSDGIAIPGNIEIDEHQKDLRIRSFFAPYHRAITAELDRLRLRTPAPALISIHSCTPVFDRVVRPWHIGVLWDRDPRIARPLLDALEAMPDICVGDNEPYSGRHPHDYTIDHHAEPDGLPHVGIEIRQDLIDSKEGAAEWAGYLYEGFRDVLADPDLYTRFDQQSVPT
jgi:predicted N-formylglutamate amidohydrolase